MRIWIQGILMATPFTLKALIMHTNKLLVDSDLLFQKVGGNVQHTLPIEQSSFTLMKWAEMFLSFFPLTYYFGCVMCIFQHQRSSLGLKACLRRRTKQKVFLFTKLWTLLPEARWSTSKAKGILCQHLMLDSNRCTSRVITDSFFLRQSHFGSI